MFLWGLRPTKLGLRWYSKEYDDYLCRMWPWKRPTKVHKIASRKIPKVFRSMKDYREFNQRYQDAINTIRTKRMNHLVK